MADSLLQEVDAALRADRAGALWQKHRGFIITVAVLMVAATAANSAWQAYREARGARMLTALTESKELLIEGKAADAAKGFKVIADGASGEFRDLALVWQARALLAANKKGEAIAALQTAVADGSSLWTDIACLRLAGLDAKAAAPCLVAKENSPLAATRAEWSAASAWAKGDHAAAIASIEKLLANPDTSADARERLTQWLASMKAEESAKK